MRTIFSVAVLLMCAIAPVRAQDASKPAEDAAPPLNLDKFALPPSAYDTSKFRYEAPPDPTAGFAPPNRVDLGASTLKFDAGRKEQNNKVGIEAVNQSLLGGIQKQQRSTLPNYLGLTLSKPLN